MNVKADNNITDILHCMDWICVALWSHDAI